jgi:hypothetical protein
MSDAAAKRRARQTLINLLLSMGATLGVVLAMVLIVPRDDTNRIQPVDYKALAVEAELSAPGEILVPEMPVDWSSNSARYRSAEQDGVANWYVGFVGPKNEFLAFTQGFEVNQTWIALQLEATKPTSEIVIEGETWKIFQATNPRVPAKSKDYLMLLEYEGDAVVLYGIASEQQFEDLASQLTKLSKEQK